MTGMYVTSLYQICATCKKCADYLFDLYEERRLMFTDSNLFFYSPWIPFLKGRWRAQKGHPLPSNLLSPRWKGDRKGGPDVLNPSQGSEFIWLLKFFITHRRQPTFLGLFPSLRKNRFFCWKKKVPPKKEKIYKRDWKGHREGECMQEFRRFDEHQNGRKISKV